MNAFNLAMWDALQRVMAEVNGDDSLRCVVLRGAGAVAANGERRGLDLPRRSL